MSWRIPVVFILALVVALGCDQQATDPVEQPVAAAPTFDFSNGPPESGVVIRVPDEMYLVDLFWETPADPWILWMGLEPGQAPSWCVGGDEEPNTESLWALAKKGEKSNEIWKKNQVPVTVFDLQEHWDLFFEGLGLGENPYCYAVMRAEPIGGGEGNYRDSWKLHYGNDGYNAHFNGKVYYMGETYQLKWMYKNAVGSGDVHVAIVH